MEKVHTSVQVSKCLVKYITMPSRSVMPNLRKFILASGLVDLREKMEEDATKKNQN